MDGPFKSIKVYNVVNKTLKYHLSIKDIWYLIITVKSTLNHFPMKL